MPEFALTQKQTLCNEKDAESASNMQKELYCNEKLKWYMFQVI